MPKTNRVSITQKYLLQNQNLILEWYILLYLATKVLMNKVESNFIYQFKTMRIDRPGSKLKDSFLKFKDDN